MKSSDPGRIGAGNNGAGRVDEIDIITADVFDGVNDLLGKGVADVCDHGILLEKLMRFLSVSISYIFQGFNLDMLSITIKYRNYWKI